MKKCTLSIILTSILLIVLAGCTTNAGEEYKEITGIDLSDYKPLSVYDTHGGFHGDGIKCEIYDCSNTDIEDTIKNSHVWKKVPFSHNVEILLYGTKMEDESKEPYLKDGSGNTFVPQIKNGFYTFYDRHADTENPRDDTKIFNRGSFNLSLSVFDADNQKLYYLELDT